MGQLSYSFNNMGQQLIVSYQADKVYTSINQELLYQAQMLGDVAQIKYLLTNIAESMLAHIKEDIYSLLKKEWEKSQSSVDLMKSSALGVGKPLGTNAGVELQKMVPGLKLASSVCPSNECNYNGGAPSPLKAVIIHLNDMHRWTREQIADWLDTLDFDLTIHKVEEDSSQPEIPLPVKKSVPLYEFLPKWTISTSPILSFEDFGS